MNRRARAIGCALALALALSPATAPVLAQSAPAPAPAPVAFADTRAALDGLTVTARVAQRPGAAANAPFEVGTAIAYELVFEGDARASASIDAARTLGEFDVLSVRGPATGPDGAVTAEIVVTTLESGTVAPPPVTLRWATGGAVRTAEFTLPAIEVKSVLGAEIDPANYRDIAGEFALAEEARSRTLVLAVVAATVLASAGIAYFLWRRLRRAMPEPSADLWAIASLAELEREALPARGDFARYYDRLTGIVRGYVARRFAIPAERQTSREFLAAATSHAEFPEGERDRLRGLLRLADLVKFASATPERAECDAHLADARAFVDATRPRDEAAARAEAAR